MNLESFVEYYYSNDYTVKKLTESYNKLDVSTRKAFIDYLSEAEREEFINKIRKQAVNDFWTHEQELIRIIQ